MSTLESYRDVAPFSARELVNAANSILRNKPDLEISERTLRYYVSQDLLPPPEGPTKFARYSFNHLVALAAIRFLQDQGISLDRIRAEIASLFETDSVAVLALTIDKLSTWLSRQNQERSIGVLRETESEPYLAETGGFSRMRRTRPTPGPPRQSDENRSLGVRMPITPLERGLSADRLAPDLEDQVSILRDAIAELQSVVRELKAEIQILRQQSR